MKVGLFITDFEFGTKVAEKLSELESNFEFCETYSDIPSDAQLLIADLDDNEIGNEKFIQQLAGENKNLRIIGIMKQVQKDQHTVFKIAGCSMILPKSSLIKNIATFILNK